MKPWDEIVAEATSRVTDPAKKELVARIAADAVRVAAMATTDPAAAEREAAHLKAQSLNLAAAEASAVSLAVGKWAQQFVYALVLGAL